MLVVLGGGSCGSKAGDEGNHGGVELHFAGIVWVTGWLIVWVVVEDWKIEDAVDGSCSLLLVGLYISSRRPSTQSGDVTTAAMLPTRVGGACHGRDV